MRPGRRSGSGLWQQVEEDVGRQGGEEGGRAGAGGGRGGGRGGRDGGAREARPARRPQPEQQQLRLPRGQAVSQPAGNGGWMIAGVRFTSTTTTGQHSGSPPPGTWSQEQEEEAAAAEQAGQTPWARCRLGGSSGLRPRAVRSLWTTGHGRRRGTTRGVPEWRETRPRRSTSETFRPRCSSSTRISLLRAGR